MNIIKLVIKHSLIVLTIWIIIIAISVPALLKLEEVTQYRAERLIPSGVESDRASRELVKITNRTGESAIYEVILITGINVTNPDLLNTDLEILNNIKSHVVNYNSPYRVIREILSNIDADIYNTTISIFNTLNQTLLFLEIMYSNGTIILNIINNTHNYILFICKYYDEFNTDLGKTIASKLYMNISMIPYIYNYTSGLYRSIINQLSTALEILKYSIDTVSTNYTYTLYNIVRIHYYLLFNTTAYQHGLNKTIIENIINYTTLSNYAVDELLINKTYSYVTEQGIENISVNKLSELAINILLEEYRKFYRDLRYNFTSGFLHTYSNVYLNTLENMKWSLDSFFETLNIDPVYGQIELLNNMIELNNTVLPIAREEYLSEAALVTKNRFGFVEGSEDYIEYYYRNTLDLNTTAREILRLKIVSFTGLIEHGFIADIVHKYNGAYTYYALYDLIKYMFQFIDITKFLNYSFNSTIIPPDIVSKVHYNLASLLANKIWNRNLSNEYIYRLIIGLPIIVFISQFSNNISLIDNFLYNSDLVNSIVNVTYISTNYSLILATLEYIILNTGFNIFNYSSITISFRSIVLNNTNATINLIHELMNLPENASTKDYVKLLVETILLSSNTSIALPLNNIVDLFVSVINGVKPIDAIVNYTIIHVQIDIEPEVFGKYLRQSLLSQNSSILYIGLKEYVLQNMFRDLINRFINVFISENYSAFIITIYPIGNSLSERASNAYRALDIVRDTLIKHGFKPEYVGIIGDNVLGYEMTIYTRRDLSIVQTVSIIAPVLIALVLITGLLATIVPFIGIATSLTVSIGLIYLLTSQNIITVSSWSRVLLITTSFGLGMDYTSYIIIRFKEKYPEIRNKYEAVYESVKYALPAIIAASSTDIIGFAVMKLAWEFPLIASLGETVPIAILIVLLVSLTFTPALLVLFGDKKWFWWPHDINKPIKRIWRGFELTPRRTYLLLTITLIVISIGYIGFSRFKGSHDYSVFIPQDTVSYKSYIEFQKYFPSGKFLPVYAVLVLRENYSVYDNVVKSDLENIVVELSSKQGISNIYSFLKPGDKKPDQYISYDNKSFYIEIVLNISPLSREGINLVKEIRNYLHSINYIWLREVLVGGLPASSSEVEEMLNNIFWTRVFPIALILMWICMALSFNSFLAGLIALVTIITGYLFGIAAAVYVADLYDQPVLWFLTLMTLPAVLGVGLDYNSFYMNRQRYELMRGRNSYEASTIAVRTVSHIVIGLGLIVTATYGGIAYGSSWGLREIGIALSTSVFVTTILSSIVFVPAILAFMNTKAWWPGVKRWRK